MEFGTIKLEKTEVVEIMDSEPDTEESQPLSEDSEPCYEHLKQTGLQICTDDYSGQFNFDFFLDVTEMSKRHWMYSTTLNKVYIDMNRGLPIQFQWHFDKVELLGIKNLRIRALPIFVNPEYRQLSIKRCPVHIMQDTFPDEKKNHIIWCEQNDAMYEEDLSSQRYSVIVSVPNSVLCSDYRTYNVLYRFMCKSSCSMSLNRRPIYIIFTLETIQGQVLGRKKFSIKVCSCPKRDMLKEEELEKKRLTEVGCFKRQASSNTNNLMKIPKISGNDENTMYKVPILPIVGKQLYISTLKLLHGHFLGTAVRNDNLIDLHPLISMLADLITQVKSENNNHKNDVDSKNQLTQINDETFP